MNRKRRLLVELLEGRRLLAVMGPEDPAQSSAWQAVIVELNSSMAPSTAAAQSLLNPSSGRLDYTFDYALKGFSARLPRDSLEALRNDPRVAHVEPDIEMRALGQILPTGVDRIDADAAGLRAAIDGADDRVDVDIAIIDSGIDGSHPDLNVVGGYNATGGSTANWNDGHGHGTHVAGIAAALDNDIGVVGVAPGARLWAVKVLGNRGTGSLSNIIKGIDWVTAHANEIEVANMSLGGQGVSAIYRQAIQRSVAAGVVYIAAAGNEYRDILGGNPSTASPTDSTADSIPAAYPEVATISALTDTDGRPGGLGPSGGGYADDTFADFSNFSNSGADGASWYLSNNLVDNPRGLGIDLVLPGVNIYSTYKGGAYATMSGTSMAAPHAAGLAARYIAENGRATDAAGVYAIRQGLINNAKAWRDPQYGLQFTTPGNSDSPDKFEENIGWAGPAGPVNQPPVASDDSYTIAEDHSLVTNPSVLSNDFDPEEKPLTAILVTNSSHGTLSLAADGSFAYVPNANFNGLDSFTYKANDGVSNSNLATVTITVQAVNDAPVAADKSLVLYQGSTQSLVLAASDVDGDDLTYSIVVGPTHGTLSGSGANWSYTPNPLNYIGTDSFTFTASDGSSTSNVATVALDIQPIPTEVVLFADSFENGPSSNSNNWNGRWVEDSQSDFFRSSQRATDGARSAEVDGFASNATLSMASSVDLSGYASAQLTFQWLIEYGFDAGEFLALDISVDGGATWSNDVRRLVGQNGNASVENAWHSESVDLTSYRSANVKIRFRSTVSSSSEDANIDDVKLTASMADNLLAGQSIASTSSTAPSKLLPKQAVRTGSIYAIESLVGTHDNLLRAQSELARSASSLSSSLFSSAIDELLGSDDDPFASAFADLRALLKLV